MSLVHDEALKFEKVEPGAGIAHVNVATCRDNKDSHRQVKRMWNDRASYCPGIWLVSCGFGCHTFPHHLKSLFLTTEFGQTIGKVVE